MVHRKSWLSALAALLLAAAPLTAPPAYAEEPPIDVSTDADRDGVPDMLAAEVRRAEAAPDRQAALAGLVRRLPYSPRTRALQREAERVQARLESTKDPQQAEKIVAQLRTLSDRMLEDPSYRAAVQGIEKLVPVRGRERRGARPAARVGTPERRATGSGGIQAAASAADDLWPGVVMLVHSADSGKADFLYAQWYSHAGTYNGAGTVYEANPDGVRLKPYANWQQPGQYVALGYDWHDPSTTRVADALQQATTRYGTDGRTPYNYNFPDKWTDSRLYCSQLVWKIHGSIGVDVDSNDWGYKLWIASRWGWWAVPTIAVPAVAPDEIAADPDVVFFHTDWN